MCTYTYASIKMSRLGNLLCRGLDNLLMEVNGVKKGTYKKMILTTANKTCLISLNVCHDVSSRLK